MIWSTLGLTKPLHRYIVNSPPEDEITVSKIAQAGACLQFGKRMPLWYLGFAPLTVNL